jgi:nucleotide-binding universal stress UspA family protein
MDKKLLIAVDDSARGLESVSVLGSVMEGHKEIKLLLFHCVQQMATMLPGELVVDVEGSVGLPQVDLKKIGAKFLEEGKRRLLDTGFPEDRIELKLKMDSLDPGQDIMSEAVTSSIRSVALGRRGRSPIEALLIGSVSSKVAQYAKDRTVWIVDTPVPHSRRVLIAMEGAPDCRALSKYTADFIAPIPGLKYTFLHLMPPVPPTFWDDGHILGSAEQKDRQTRVERWATDWVQKVEGFMSEARSLLVERGVPERSIETRIEPTKEGVARDLLNEIAKNEFEVVVMGKKSFHERKPFLLGSHANKILQSTKNSVLCLVDAQ